MYKTEKVPSEMSTESNPLMLGRIYNLEFDLHPKKGKAIDLRSVYSEFYQFNICSRVSALVCDAALLGYIFS